MKQNIMEVNTNNEPVLLLNDSYEIWLNFKTHSNLTHSLSFCFPEKHSAGKPLDFLC